MIFTAEDCPSPPIGVKIRNDSMSTSEPWPVFDDEVNSQVSLDFPRSSPQAKRPAPARLRAVPRGSCGSATRHYACTPLGCNSYPQGESAPAGSTNSWAKAAAKKRASIHALAVGPCRDGKASKCSNDFRRLKNNSICQRNRYTCSS